jgi:hypothetical protein
MPTTKQQVINAINKIADNGNNTANTVRGALNEIVEYATPAEVNNLGIQSYNGIINDKINALSYSIKVIENEFINFTFHIACIEPSLKGRQGTLSFNIDPSLFKILATILPNAKASNTHPSYMLDVQSRNAKKEALLLERYGIPYKLTALRFALVERTNSLQVLLNGYNKDISVFETDDFISSSIAIHHQKNN